MKKRKSGVQSVKSANSIVKSVLIGTGIGILVWMLLLVVASAVISGLECPENFVTVTAFVLIALSSFVAGIISVKLSRLKNIFPGVISGALMLLLVWAFSLALSQSTGVVSLPLKMIIVFNFIFFAVLGGIIGKPSPKIKRRVGR